ncbi:MAG: histidine kinase dimerization/phosphoacceptor domain -containing protein [Myxococcales bacterium]|nr:PAS domain-containing protein [Myxococcales bacterium]
MNGADDSTLTPAAGAAILAQLARGATADRLRATPLPQQLAIAEARYRALVEQIPAVTFMASLAGGLSDVYVSPQIEGLLGFSQEEWMSDPVLWFRQLHPDDRELWNHEFARGCATGGPFRAECRFLTKDRQVVWVHGEARLIPDESGQPVLLQGVAFDITESKRAEEIVKNSLREKELLLKEIHHRVKNNLQITSSLLRLQAGKIADASVRQLLRESQDRIRSMALVHDMLYRSQDLARVDFPEYVRVLVIQLFRSYNASGRIRADVQLENIVFGVDLAVPCGLIINELVANALKHAFPGDRQGVVRVRMSAAPDRYTLLVEDDGIGFPAGLDFLHTETLGLQLVRMLTEQIGGRVFLDSSRAGTGFRVEIPTQPEAR